MSMLRNYVLIFLLVANLVSGIAFSQTTRIDITDGQVARIPIAIADFTGSDGTTTPEGRQISKIISDDLQNSGLFDPVDSAAFINPPSSPDITPNFANWSPLGVEGLLVGSAYFDSENMLQLEFKLWDVVTQKALTEGGGSADPAGLRRIAHKVADFVYVEFTGDKKYFDTKIVYISESGPQDKRVKRLAIMDQDGHNHRFLTSGRDLVLTPRFSPTAHEIAYLNYFNDEPNIYLFEVATGRTEKLGSFPGMTFAPRFHPDGNKLIMSLAQDGATNIFEMDLLSRATRQLTNTIHIDTAPSYSPDGKKIVFESDRDGGRQQLFIMDSDGRNVQRISYNKGRYATPVWSPRGDFIAFTKMLEGEFFIGIMRTDGSAERLLARGFLVEAPTWAPNGRVLMYYKQDRFEQDGSGGNTRLYKVDITGFNESIMNTPADASDPAWSPLLGGNS
ncbi:MAG: Tol-Pal system protein TolB [Alphaproteobacteria bacterium]|nr:Tol-Pal system protein TolB [Alphaproteobacteria bacterium]